MAVLGTQALEQRDGVGERLNPRHRSVGHIEGGLSPAADVGDVDPLCDEILDQGVVATCRRVMDGVVAIVVTVVDVCAQFLHENPDGAQPTVRYMAV